jgi:hypothetical protein
MLKSGTILLGKHPVPCTVRNLSEIGACLQLQTTVGIPSKFSFAMSDRPTRICKIIWRDDTRIGVLFQ